MRHWDDPIKPKMPKLPKDPWTWQGSWLAENCIPLLIYIIGMGAILTLLFFGMFVWVPAGS